MGRILDRIDSPADLRRLGRGELAQLCRELRETVTRTVARNGGHLASNLGVAELTVALHLVFDSPQDKIIWDCGHQCYVHKLLTGRRSSFPSLRQLGGIAGFPRLDESPHDAFQTGHSSTAISAALGMAKARDLRGEGYRVVAVVGDGAMTGGMAFEALNHAGHTGAGLVVVLNDNEMTYGRTVGALASYLSRLRSSPAYYRVKADVKAAVRRIPEVGERLASAVKRLKGSVKYLLVPGVLFEELGFTYLGPIDGHDLDQLLVVLRNARSHKGPVLVHVLTKKGKGYPPAEANPGMFHAASPFDEATGMFWRKDEAPTYTDVFALALTELARRDPRIVAVTAAMSQSTGLDPFAREFPERLFDVGIAEQHAVTFAAGMAAAGLRPVVAIYSTFLQRAYDQILHDVCLQRLPVVFALDRAGIVGGDGPTHHGMFDFAYLRHIPHMVVMAPKDENELARMLKSALSYGGPAAVRYPRGAGRGVPVNMDLPIIPCGAAEKLREGRDAAILAVGSMVAAAEEAAEMLSREGIECTVVNCRFVKPLDVAMLGDVVRTCRVIVTAEEHVLAGGFGSAVAETLGTEKAGEEASRMPTAARLVCLGLPDEFVEHGEAHLLRDKYGLSASGIAGAVRQAVAGAPDSAGRRERVWR